MTGPRGRARRFVRWGSVVVGSALCLAACSGVRNSLGTANSPCYVALPAATSAVRHGGKLAGVRLERVDALPSTHVVYRVAGGARAEGDRVCLVAFRGDFQAGGVSMPKGRSDGPFAVVVLSYPGDRLLGTVILRRVPLSFGHSHSL